MEWWSWILTIVGLTGFILAGRKVWWCWYINIGCQALWFTYAIVTEQYGFIVASLAYTVVFTQNAIKWTREHRDPIGEHLKKMDFNEVAMPPPRVPKQFCGDALQHGSHNWSNRGFSVWCPGQDVD